MVELELSYSGLRPSLEFEMEVCHSELKRFATRGCKSFGGLVRSVRALSIVGGIDACLESLIVKSLS